MLYQREFTSSNVTTGESALGLIAGTKPYWLKQVTVRLTAATASIFALCRPATTGTPATSVFTLLSLHDIVSRSLAGAIASWTVSPTSPTTFYEKIVFPATVGSSATLIFHEGSGPGGIFVPATGMLSFQNFGPTGASSFSVRIWEE